MASNKERTVERIYPLTPMQEGMLFHKMLDEHSTSYVVQEVISIKSVLHETYLNQTLELLGERHPILRTAIVYRKVKKPQQVLLKNRKIEMKLIDISAYSDEEKQEEIRQIKREDIARGFDLEKDSLMRMTILQTGCGEYKMIWSFHHIIMDGWCLSILCSDFMHYYLALSQGTEQDILREAIRKETAGSSSYEAYIHWLKEQNHEACLDYWKHLLADYSGVAEIAPSRTAVVTGTAVGQLQLELSETLSESIVRLCRQHHVTSNTLFELCWGIVLQRYNNVQDVVFGKVVSGRNAKLKDIDKMVGLFINTIPVRVKIEENDSFETLVPRLYDQAVESGKHDYSPLAEIQRVSGIGGDSLKTLMVFENFYVNPAADELESLLSIEADGVREKTNYAMNLMIDHTNIFTMKMMYDPSLYHELDIGRLLQQMQQLITGMVNKPSLPIQEIEIVTPEEQQLILHHFNDTQTEYPHELTIQQLFRQQAAQNPDAEAVLSPMERLTYAELDRRSDEIMGEMKRKGLQEGRLVGIVTEKSVHMIAGILAIVKCGCGYVPLDGDYPESRLRFMLEDCQIDTILCSSGTIGAGAWIPEGIHRIDIRERYERFDMAPYASSPSDTAYVIYTSGSTGMPKGVVVSHQNVIRLVQQTNYVDFSDARILQTGALSFDAATFEIWGSLLNGGALCLIDSDLLADPGKLAELVEQNRLNTMFLTSQLFNNLVDLDMRWMKGMKNILTGGQAISERHVNKLLQYHQDLTLIHCYGPTENTTFSLTYKVEHQQVNIPIGQSISNSTAYIMNGTTLCGIGMTGELCLGGDGVAKGYLNREELTRQKFIDNPYVPGERIYRTGDLARWLPDGNIEFLGRMDEQVKIRGHRIEPGEIESVLRNQPGIIDAAVVTRRDPAGEMILCAYIVNSGPVIANAIDLKQQLRQVLPEYMIPSYLMALDRLPVTRNGKLDRRALPEPSEWGHRVITAPRNPVEDMLASVFKEVLGLEEVSIDDSFFDLGGHSLKAARVVNLIESSTGIRLPLRTLFESSTVAAIGELLSEQGERSFEPIPVAAIKRDYPMSSAQKRLYVIHQMDDLGTVYNMPGVLKLEGKLDPARIQATFQELVRRHESLRTSFHMIEGELLQRIEEHAEMAFTCEELDHGAAVDAAGLLDAFITPFDLAQAPLLRTKIVKIDADQSLLLVDMHHIISDAATIQIIMKEFTQLYNGETLPPLTVQYKDYSEWLRSRDLREQESYWLKQFDDEIPVLDLPLDYPRPQTQQFSGGSFTLNLKDTVRAQVQQLSRETGATEYMVLLASFMVLLHKYTRQEDVIVGTPISGRTHPDTEAMVGMFVNTLALRGRPAGEKTYASFLSEVREVCLQAYSHQEYPLEDLVERVQVQRDMSRNPLFDVVFVLQSEAEAGATTDGMTIREEEVLPKTAKFDLTVTVEPGSAGYAVNWAYCDALFKEESVRRMAVHFERILEEALGAPQQRISEMEVVTEREQAQILQMFNEDNAEYDTEVTVAELFAEQVRRVPGRIAAVCEGEELTYAELDQRAGRIAAQLRQRISTEAMVGVRLERDLNLVTAILGVVQAGGVYLPIDPDAPAERTSYILADSGVQVLLTSRTMHMAMAAPFSGEVLYVEDLLAEEDAAESQPAIQLRPEQGLYVIYTSGTTGNPKGTMIEHRNVVRLMKNSAFPFEFTEEDVWTLFHGTSFDFSVWEMYGALLYGGKLVIVPKGTAQDSYALRELLLREQVTVLNQVPSSFYELMQADANEAAGKLALRYLIFGGEALNPRKLKAWRERNPEVEIVNMYGITETTVHVTYKTVTEQDIEAGISNIGRAIPTTSVYILNGTRLCGIGMPGELCVGGAGVARGYHERPELTAAKFVDNPYVPGERMYRSGDLARWLPDGSMEYLGRMDEQVKIRGYRIELGEIEQVLIQQAGIRDAAVIIRKDAAADPYICAYVVKTTEAEGLEPGEIKKALQRQLPDYMIPSRIIEVEKLPVTVNGKLDRRKLPEPVFSVGSEYTAPRNAEEAMLAEIFEQILGMERIGIDDSFFELGGNSLKAIGVISRVRSHGYSLSLLDLLKNSTVSALADCLKTVESGQARTQEVLDVHALNEQLEQLIGEEVRVLVDESGQETAVFVKDEVYVLSKEEMINRIQDSHPLLVPTVLLPFSIYQDLHIADGSGLDRLMDKHYPADVNHYVQLASDRMKEYASNWLAQPEVTRYPLSSIQKVSFILGVRSSYAELNFDRRLDVGRLEQALLQMLRLHPLLRSKIDIRPDSEHIVVVDVPSAVRIPLVDLTYMSKQMKGIITDGVRQLYRAFYEEERYTGDSLSHGLILLKKNEGSFTLLMPCTHLIFDGMSNESFCNQLLACYEDSESARDQEVQPYDYFNYIQQTGMGPRHITEDEIINTLELDLFAAAVRNYRHMTQGVTFRTVEYQFNMRDLDISGSQEQMWRLSGEIYTAVMRFFFPEAQIPVFVVHTGRKLMEQEYYDYIGEFIDLLPCVIDTGRDAALHENITNKIDFLRAHNINIASLLDNKAIQSNYPNVAAALSTVDLHHMNIPSYNYLAIYNHLQGAVLEDPNRITRTEHESDAFTFEHTSTNVVMIGETIYISTMCKEGCETELEDYLAGILQHMQGSQQYAQKIPVYEFIR